MGFHSKPNIYVGEVNLKVSNLERSIRFYQEVIGFKVVEQTDRKVKLSADGKTVLLSLEQPANVIPKEKNTTGLYHFAVLLPARSDLADIVNHFIKIGLPIGSSDHLVSEALYFSDPDGNGIEIYADRSPEEWTWRGSEVHMTVDPLDFRDLLTEAAQEWKGLPAGTVMGHIHLHVSDLHKAQEFYTKALGFDVVSRLGNQARFLATGRYHHHIGINTWAGEGAPEPSKNSIGLNWFTLIYPSKEAREQAVEQLRSIGSMVHQEKDGFITWDPSGNQILLLV
ncbi:VOC family protein [Peribacillus deserti]|uniref:Glyoxalase n=1 Tax=Peribacillus deserti TaxID=673318 RepID=A0A2N5M8E3_9BACI|nr:VOC family protein [Peribacillus deserti]PLT30651.1 glyoxalase [Peribacillus deserti]